LPPSRLREKIGFTSGGPIVNSRIFFFGGYEGTRETQGEVQFGTTISDTRWLQGDFSGSSATIRDPLTGQPFAGNRIPANRIVPFASLQLDKIPIANLPGNANNYRIIRNFTENTDTVTFRLDQVLSSSHNLFERFMWYDSQQVIPGAFNDQGRPQKGRNFAAGHTWVLSPTLVNEVRFGYNYAYHVAENLIDGEDYLSRNCQDIGLKNLQAASRKIFDAGATITSWRNRTARSVSKVRRRTFSISTRCLRAGAHNLRFGFQAHRSSTGAGRSARGFIQRTSTEPPHTTTFADCSSDIAPCTGHRHSRLNHLRRLPLSTMWTDAG
jgi:hypothetical protein